MNPQFAAAAAELCKMALQLLGALLIARLAVNWALGRYKAEKLWERETAALADILSAIGEMRTANAGWIREAQSMGSQNEEWETRQKGLYRSGREKLRAVASVAEVVLPQEAAVIVQDLQASLDAPYDSWIDDLFETDTALKDAREKLIGFGRRLRTGAKG